MDVLLDEQQIEIQNAAAEFLTGECPATLVRQSEKAAIRYSPELWKKFAANGWLQLSLPEAYGGQGLPLIYLGLLFEEVGRHIAPIPVHGTLVAAQTLARYGNPSQRELLKQIATGNLIVSCAIVEESGRWSPDAIALQGRVEGDQLVLNGAKCFVDGYRESSQCLVLFRGASGLGAVLVPTNSKGLTHTDLVTTAKDSEAMVKFENVRVPRSNVVGTPEQGAALVNELMDVAAVLYASLMAGAGRRMLDMAVEYAKQRVAFEQPIGAFQAIQHMCADMVNAIDGTLLLSHEALWRMGEGMSASVQVSQAKAFANEKCLMVARSAQQIHGGMGFMIEFDLNHWYRRIASWGLRGGTVAEHRKRVAAALLDHPGHVRLGMPLPA